MLSRRGLPKKASRPARMASDEEIQGSKDAVIQDLERKLRFKEDLLNNGQPVGGGRGRGHDEQGQSLEPALTSLRAGASSSHLAFPSTILTAGVAPPAPTRLSGLMLACGGESMGGGFAASFHEPFLGAGGNPAAWR